MLGEVLGEDWECIVLEINDANKKTDAKVEKAFHEQAIEYLRRSASGDCGK